MLQHCSLKKKKELEETEKVTHAACLAECYFNTNVEILLCAQTLFFRVDKKKTLEEFCIYFTGDDKYVNCLQITSALVKSRCRLSLDC